MRELDVSELQPLAAQAAAAGAPLLLLDVREPWEVELAALELPQAETRCIPMGSLVQRLAELDPAQPVVCVCHHGVRSAHVAHFLQRQGHASVYNLSGGIDAWSTQVDPAVARY